MEQTKSGFSFSWTYKDFEIRTTANTVSDRPYVELVKWYYDRSGRRCCYTLAYWAIDENGAELRFVGDRPFRDIADIDIGCIWKQLWLAGDMFNDWLVKESNND